MNDYRLEFLKVALAHLLAVASPGPDLAIVLRQSLSHGRSTALWTSVGSGTGILLHVSWSLLGIGFLIHSSAFWFGVVKYAGAAYIGWIGVQALRSKPREASAVEFASTSAPRGHGAFAAGFLTNALNPKATLFFLSLFVMLVSPQTPRLVQAGYGLWMALATMGWFAMVSVLFTQERVRASFLRHGHWIDRALGVVFLFFALGLVFAKAG